MGQRLVIERLASGKAAPLAPEKVDAPSLTAIRVVFGVGRGPSAPPSDETFKPVYTVEIPVFSLGGLDSDGVHEFQG